MVVVETFPFVVADFDDDDSVEGCELVCILKLAVRTNWPTAAEKPLRKALKGYIY